MVISVHVKAEGWGGEYNKQVMVSVYISVVSINSVTINFQDEIGNLPSVITSIGNDSGGD